MNPGELVYALCETGMSRQNAENVAQAVQHDVEKQLVSAIRSLTAHIGRHEHDQMASQE